jgi:hypothetical protein
MEGNDMENRYSLHGFIIVEGERRLGWIQHVGDWNNTGGMMYISGSAYIHKEYDVLLLGRWRSIEEDCLITSFDDVEKYLKTLPKWNKTKYYVKLSDITLDSLIECGTGEVVFSEKNPEIFKSLQFIDEERK